MNTLIGLFFAGCLAFIVWFVGRIIRDLFIAEVNSKSEWLELLPKEEYILGRRLRLQMMLQKCGWIPKEKFEADMFELVATGWLVAKNNSSGENMGISDWGFQVGPEGERILAEIKSVMISNIQPFRRAANHTDDS